MPDSKIRPAPARPAQQFPARPLQPPQSGRFAVKLQSEAPPQDQAAVQALSAWQLADTPLLWAAEKDYVALFGGDEAIGRIRNEFLSIGGHTLLLTDLTGMM